MKNKSPFTAEQELQLLEIANRCLQDAELFDEMAGNLDLSDKQMAQLRDCLQSYLGGKP
jgi:hypothetical protein